MIREVGRMATGAAGNVERQPDREGVQDRVDHGLLPLEHQVARLVVRRRPAVVRLGGVDDRDVDAAADLLGSVEKGADLSDPGLGVGAIELAVEGPEQGDAL